MSEPTDIAGLIERAGIAIAAAGDLAALDAARVAVLGKAGELTQALAGLGKLPADQRKAAGQRLNEAKRTIEAALEARKAALAESALQARLIAETLDVSLPARPDLPGRLHPISQTIDEIVAIFGQMGFSVAEGPDIEDDFHNFTALNFPPGHPAREMHDTFYLPDRAEDGSRILLRTHTSPVQIRTMLRDKPPIRVIIPGRTFRSDSDMTHTPMFHQVEGLVIDETTHMGHLKGTLLAFVRAYFEVQDLKIRFRPSFFPFTEPSVEVDIGCDRSAGKLVIGSGNDWLEILGAGMVHPNVIRNCGLDPSKYQGFAFGMGIERIAMLKYGIPDLRTFFDGDIRWSRHYGFAPLDVPSLITGLGK